MLELGSALDRFVGMRVAVAFGGHSDAVGMLVASDPGFIRLTDVRMIDDSESQGWLGSMSLDDDESLKGSSCPEIVIARSWIRSVRCLDDANLDVPDRSSRSPGADSRKLRHLSNPIERLAAGKKVDSPANGVSDGSGENIDDEANQDAVEWQRSEPAPPSAMTVEIGAGLVGLAAPGEGSLDDRIRRTRRVLREELGVTLPGVRLRSIDSLGTFGFRILADECVIIQGEIPQLQSLAIDRSGAEDHPKSLVLSHETVDPILGRRAYWISPDERDAAALAGYSIVEPDGLITTCLAETARRTAAEWLTYEMVDELFGELRERHPLTVGQLYPQVVPLRTIHGVLRGLLAERVSVRNLARILESLGRHISSGVAYDDLLARVRVDQARVVCRPHCDDAMNLTAIMLDDPLTDMLREAFAGFALRDYAEPLAAFDAVLQARWESSAAAPRPVLVVVPKLRQPLREHLRRALPECAVLSTEEICAEVTLRREPLIAQRDIERWLDEREEARGRVCEISNLADTAS